MAAAAQALVLKFALGMVLVVEMVKEHYTSMEYIQLLGFGGSDSSALELCNQKRLGRNCFIFFNVIIKWFENNLLLWFVVIYFRSGSAFDLVSIMILVKD